jgi:hypothetical protein
MKKKLDNYKVKIAIGYLFKKKKLKKDFILSNAFLKVLKIFKIFFIFNIYLKQIYMDDLLLKYGIFKNI